MLKKFCDICNKEITDKTEGFNLTAVNILMDCKAIMFKVESTLGVNGAATDADVCKYCVIDAIIKLDDRVIAK